MCNAIFGGLGYCQRNRRLKKTPKSVHSTRSRTHVHTNAQIQITKNVNQQCHISLCFKKCIEKSKKSQKMKIKNRHQFFPPFSLNYSNYLQNTGESAIHANEMAII